jgi:hypothetical protein
VGELGYSVLLDATTSAGSIGYVAPSRHDPKACEFRKSAARREISITWRDL